jgi:2-oxoglutarate dehydrogenase E1 component
MSDTEDHVPSGLSASFLENVHAEYMADPSSLPDDWHQFLRTMGDEGQALAPLAASFHPRSIFHRSLPVSASQGFTQQAFQQDRVDQMVRAYRVRGHMMARLSPLSSQNPKEYPPELDPAFYGFTEAHFDQPFSAHTIQGPRVSTLRKILERLRNTYCRSIGVQFMHIDDLDVRHWLQARMEGTENRLRLGRDEQLRILTGLTDAVVFEEFIRKKYVGAKSFSLEGAESLIPLLDMSIERAGRDGIERIVLAMAHRGRLNVLANIMGKCPKAIFSEFEDRDPQLSVGRGDVKYHLGYSHDWTTSNGRTVHLTLCFNPSHLEYVNPVALGRIRARQDRIGDGDRRRNMAILIHGDAAFAGEGIVQETLNLSELAAYSTGGTLHVILNNQIGFTTPPSEGRSSIYASGLAKMLQIPIFHVNGEDPEAVAQVLEVATQFRRDFRRDVVIDMWCYRRRGHSESDEPSFTQPMLYHAIEKCRSVRDGYLSNLLKLQAVTQVEADEIATQRRARLEEALHAARREEPTIAVQPGRGIWLNNRGGPESTADSPNTAVERERLVRLLEAQTRTPHDFHPHPKLLRWIDARLEMAGGKRPLDWSAAEALAFASLATEGVRIRMSGQDTARGTFSHRHAAFHDVEDGHPYIPLQHLTAEQAPIEIFNSPLSEAGVLGFEYGYSLDCPDGLVLWEAQFGDFCNAAQVVIDQFIASAEDKWQRWSGLVLLLPHGFEGQGPEHSSARLERFLMLAAEDNIQIVFPTTPAQYFHVLRRQALRRWKKPLVILTPKSLLRHSQATSSLDALASGGFERILADDFSRDVPPSRIILCTGKIYYDLAARRQEESRQDVVIVRVEQLYPLQDSAIAGALERYPEETPVYWVQEEPENMGAWPYMRMRFRGNLLERLPFRGIFRAESASPATGSTSSHKLETAQLLDEAFE